MSLVVVIALSSDACFFEFDAVCYLATITWKGGDGAVAVFQCSDRDD